MTKAELVEHVATTVQLPKHQIDAVLTRCLQGIMDVVHKGNTIELRGFGRFRLRHRPARTGRNPRTGDMLHMPAKAVPAFTVGKAFQTLVQTRTAPSRHANDVDARKQTTSYAPPGP
jgi:DNA-binding protein HU-beta